jgi:circadian clock protein KaiB
MSEPHEGNPQLVELRLYIAGDSPNSIEAISNIKSICETYLPNRHRIEIINVLEEPLRPIQDGVLITPTLVKLSPPPVFTVIGDLSERSQLLLALGIETPHE